MEVLHVELYYGSIFSKDQLMRLEVSGRNDISLGKTESCCLKNPTNSPRQNRSLVFSKNVDHFFPFVSNYGVASTYYETSNYADIKCKQSSIHLLEVFSRFRLRQKLVGACISQDHFGSAAITVRFHFSVDSKG